jgi:hypothetical protein
VQGPSVKTLNERYVAQVTAIRSFASLRKLEFCPG